MKLIVVRHGETVENVNGIVIGHTHGSLSEGGKEQARKVGKRLKDERIDVIYSSDLKRALDTAREIARFHPDTPLVVTEELRERDWGAYDGRTHEELDWPRVKATYGLYSAPEGGETFGQIYSRIEGFLKRVVEKHPRGTVLFVTHNELIKALLSVIRGDGPDGMFGQKGGPNTNVSVFEIVEDGKHKIHLLHDAGHLEQV